MPVIGVGSIEPAHVSNAHVVTRGQPKICGAAPIQASSGRTTRHRLDFGGDRQANRALHLIAVCRLRHCDRTRAYAAKRATDGLNKREVIRCLKRYIARQTYHTLRADLEALNST